MRLWVIRNGMRDAPDAKRAPRRQGVCMGPTALEQLTAMLTLAAAAQLMVIAGLAKKQLSWRPRPPFWRRWRR